MAKNIWHFLAFFSWMMAAVLFLFSGALFGSWINKGNTLAAYIAMGILVTVIVFTIAGNIFWRLSQWGSIWARSDQVSIGIMEFERDDDDDYVEGADPDPDSDGDDD